MARVVVPELLDHLPAHDPAARRSRRDLLIFNRVLGVHRWWDRVLARPALGRLRPGLELGAGEGHLAHRHGLHALDRAPAPPCWPMELDWHQTDVHEFDRWPDYPLIAANLFLHHLTDDELATLGAHLDRHARFILACETARAPLFRLGFTLLCRLTRADPVSRHDGRVSIDAGFRGQELAHALQLSPSRWTWEARLHPLGTYRFIARRR